MPSLSGLFAEPEKLAPPPEPPKTGWLSSNEYIRRELDPETDWSRIWVPPPTMH
jgi:hypothetical protein